MRGTQHEIKIRDSTSQSAREWRGSRAYVLLGGSLGCHFSHTTPFLRQHHPSPLSHSWSDSFRDHRNSSYDVCGGWYYSSARENNGSAAEAETGFSIAEIFSELLHQFQVAYLNKVTGWNEYHSVQWARKIMVLYKTGFYWQDQRLKRSEVIRKEQEISGKQDMKSKYKQNWIDHFERMDNTSLPKHALNYKPRGRRNRGRPRKRWQRFDAGTGQAT